MKRNSLSFLLLLHISFWGSLSVGQTFRLHLFIEPQSLDPHKQRTSNGSYLLGNLFRNLYSWSNEKGLQPDLAEKCFRKKKTKILCRLKPNLKWSDGTPLTSLDFIESYKRILNPQTKAPRADLLFPIEGAQKLYLNQKNGAPLTVEKNNIKNEFGVKSISDTEFEINLESESPEFEYALASPLASPISKKYLDQFEKNKKPDQNTKYELKTDSMQDPKENSAEAFSLSSSSQIPTSGPYKIKNWVRSQKIILVNNELYYNPTPRPAVEFSIIEDDLVALKLYEKNQLDFLRRLPTAFIPQWKSSSEFFWANMIRFDYFGFGSDLKNKPEWRQALSESLNYEELASFYQSEGAPPGCAGIPESWVDHIPCIKFKKTALPKTQSPIEKEFWYSTQGGDDHRKTAEWMQSQWKTRLKFNIEIRAFENKVFLEKLKKSPPLAFRKGLSPDRPTCSAVLETFTPENTENHIQMNAPEYLNIIKNLKSATKEKEIKKLCQKGLEFLILKHHLIPTGAMHFAILAKPNFTGWSLNSLNQLDLSNLKNKN